MAYEAYVSIKGTKQGQIKGEGTQGKRKDKWVPILSFHYSVQSPRDVATGLASGKREHKPIVITKEWGAASPQILQALTTNEVLSSVEIEFTKTDRGHETVYQTIKLTNASIVAFGPHVGSTPPGSHLHGEKYESLTLEYRDEFVTGSGGAPYQAGEVKRFGKWA
jgi:type VI secretion system secreted protein Hcp